MRPATCDCGTCRKCKHRRYVRAWYAQLTFEERRAKRSDRRRPTSEENHARYEKRKQDPDWVRKEKARNIVSNAVRDGRLVRGGCEVCGSARAQAHHDDYDHPLEVRWLCSEHHADKHRVF